MLLLEPIGLIFLLSPSEQVPSKDGDKSPKRRVSNKRQDDG
jgi:hypothetical protein